MASPLRPQWTARSSMTALRGAGRYLRVDPLDLETDARLLWEALGGDALKVNDRLKWFGQPFLKDLEEFRDLLRKIEEPNGCCVNVFRLLPSLQVSGMASYIATNEEHGTTEVGYVAHGHAMARTPAATEVHYLLARHALETMGYRRYEWKCDSRNEPSRTAALRLGFTFEGRFRQHRMTPNGNRDTDWFSMLDKEWPERQAAFQEWLDPGNFDETGRQRQRLVDIRERTNKQPNKQTTEEQN